MSQQRFEARMLDRYREQVDAGLHDDQCERRERYLICSCDRRRRLPVGPTEPPMLHVSYPVCGHCLQEVEYDGDHFRCPRCHVWWDQPETIGEFDDDHGPHDTSAERHGARLIEMIRS